MHPTTKPIGRPTQYNHVIAQALLNNLIKGESLRTICSRNDMPNKSTIFRWLANNQAFCDQYRVARELQLDTLIGEILHITDQVELSITAIKRARLQAKTRMWYASILKPRVYTYPVSE